jgi:hypothetical protein
MTLSDLASIASVVSGGAVLISLLYLSLQTRQNTKHTMALIQQGRTNQITERIGAMTSDSSLIEVVIRGIAGDQTMDDVQAFRFVNVTYSGFYNFEDQFYQHREGLLDDARHLGLTKTIAASLRNPGTQAAWKILRERFDPSFQKFIDDIAYQTPLAPVSNLGAVWKSVVAAEFSKSSA